MKTDEELSVEYGRAFMAALPHADGDPLKVSAFFTENAEAAAHAGARAVYEMGKAEAESRVRELEGKQLANETLVASLRDCIRGLEAELKTAKQGCSDNGRELICLRADYEEEREYTLALEAARDAAVRVAGELADKLGVAQAEVARLTPLVADSGALLGRLRAIVEPLRRLEADATPGPWPDPLKNGAVVFVKPGEPPEPEQRELVGRLQLFSPGDRELICAARNAVSELLALSAIPLVGQAAVVSEQCLGPTHGRGCILAKGHHGLCVQCLECEGYKRVRRGGLYYDCDSCAKREDRQMMQLPASEEDRKP